MKYYSGIDINLGDTVVLNDDEDGVVVAIIEEGKFLPAFKSEDWRYLSVGILVKSSKYGVFHYPTADEEIAFRSRGDSKQTTSG
jgi:signal peptidase I